MKEGMQEEDFAYLYALEERFWWFAGMREITKVLLDPILPQNQDRMILDAGCGTGGMLLWLARFAGRGKVVGIDVVPSALRFCRERQHTNLAQASATHLPFADSTFDGFPVFSPSGRKLVFASNRNSKVRGETNLFIADWIE